MSPDRQMLLIQFGFAAGLLPMLVHKEHKPEFVSAVWTGGFGLWMAMDLANAGLREGALGAYIVCTLWIALAYQRYRINKRGGIPLVNIPPWVAWIPSL